MSAARDRWRSWYAGATRGRRLWWTGAGLVVVIAAVVAWLVWPAPGAAPTEREFRAESACLLTDDKGIEGGLAAAAWSGLQDASAATSIMVQHESVRGPQTEGNAAPVLNAFVMQRCDLIFGVGDAPAAAIRVAARTFPHVHFVIIGDAGSGPSSVTIVDASEPNTVRTKVGDLAISAFTPS